jgi:hypothetical protein
MDRAAFMFVGILSGAFLGRLLAESPGGAGSGGATETCVYFCDDGTKKTKTCNSGDSGTCLEDLINECPGNA